MLESKPISSATDTKEAWDDSPAEASVRPSGEKARVVTASE
jgi:hypothetical protein